MKKVLVVTYYWPPSGGPGVQRVLKFVKHLPRLGWKPIVLTVENGEYPALDPGLARDIPSECDVHRTIAWEPGALYRRFTGQTPRERIPVQAPSQEGGGWRRRVASWVRLNLFVPDAKVGWIPGAVRRGRQLIARERPDLIFSSSPPSTVQLIAHRLARAGGIPWVADYRDPWTRVFSYDRVDRARWARRRDERLEQRTVRAADLRIAVNQICAEQLGGDEASVPFRVLPNGFDEDDFPPDESLVPFERLTLAYAGNLTAMQNPVNLWRGVRILLDERPDLASRMRILLMGVIDRSVQGSLEAAGLEEIAEQPGYLSHEEVIRNLRRSHGLLLLIPRARGNEAIATGKIFEYLACRRPVLGVGPPKGVAAEILRTCNCGEMIDHTDPAEAPLRRLVAMWDRDERFVADEEAISRFARARQAERLAGWFDEITAGGRTER